MHLLQKKPGGYVRFLFRLPVGLYRMRLGFLLTSHFLMLTTTGRRSGRLRHAVIEVLAVEKETGACIVVSGWGTRSDWYRNILANPQVQVDVGFRRFQASARLLEPGPAAIILADYARRHSFPFRLLARALTGEALTGAPGECARLVRQVPLVAFTPQPRRAA